MGSQCSGGWAEQQALQQLEAQGWRLLDRNWHCRWGELDLVLERQQLLLVVEVKGRHMGHRDRLALMPSIPPNGAAWPARSVAGELGIRRQLSSCSGSSWLSFP